MSACMQWHDNISQRLIHLKDVCCCLVMDFDAYILGEHIRWQINNRCGFIETSSQGLEC